MLKFVRAAALAVLVLLALAVSVRAAVSREAGLFFIQTFAAKTYAASPQNWAIAQDHRGVMYFGNTDGLLEYDGVSWRKIKIPNGSGVRSLGVDANGRVYVGAQREFGYLQPDARGELQYVSLLSSVPESERSFGDVWTIFPTSQGVYFGAFRRLFRWNPRTGMKIWKPPATRFGRLSVADDTPYVLVVNQGLYRIKSDELEPVPGGDKFADQDVRGVYQTGGSLIVVTRDAFFRQAGVAFEKIENGATKALADGQVYSTLMLDNGQLALGTNRGGLLLANSLGEVERAVGKEAGLASEKVNAVYADRQGALWLALESGIARLDLALTQFDRRNGLQGNVYAIARDSNWLYAGTSAGLFRLKPGTGNEAIFEAVPGIQDTVTVMLPAPGGLLVGTQRALYQVGPAGRAADPVAKLVLPVDSVLDLQISPRDPDRLYVAGRLFLLLLRRTGGEWHKEKEVPSGGKDFRTAVEDSDGRVWVTTLADIARFDFRVDPPVVERFSASDGVPEGWKNAYLVGGRVIFATQKGLMRFDPGDRRFKPDASLGAMFADGSRGVSILRESKDGDIWITGEGYQGILERRPGGGFDWTAMPLLGTGIGEVYTMWADPDGVAWAAGQDGWLARFDPAERKIQGPLSVLLRRVGSVDAETLWFDGAGAIASGEHKLRLKYRDNSVRFEFAAPVYEQENSTEYQVRLDGADREWSPWTTETRKDYTNLIEGAYAFHVRARSPRGQVSDAATIEFGVAPPWYRTWWAVLIYLAVIAAAVWALFQWRLAQLSARNHQLELIVAERTTEIRRQRDQIQVEEEKTKNLLLNILPALVADELRSTGAVAPMVFNEVTVCFTDFVGFTLSSEKLPARVLVSTLDKYFTAFDEIVTRYGLEKLKTIGDSYMFVSGLPNPRRSHALDAAMAAMEMLEIVQRAQKVKDAPVAWKVRIGMHTGPVVAGVVGVRKFAFDIWGNTVNLASRMESAGEGNRVNISARTYESIKDFVDCEPRGLIATKDGRALEMYFARGLRAEVSDPAAFVERYRAAFSEEPHVCPAVEPAEPEATRTLII